MFLLISLPFFFLNSCFTVADHDTILSSHNTGQDGSSIISGVDLGF